MFKKIGQLIKAKTPKIGRRIASVGIGVAGLGVTLEFTQPELLELIPEEHRIYFIIGKWTFVTIGAALGLGGAMSTEDNPDEILNK